MRPYYEQDGITIYHGDCRDVLPMLRGPWHGRGRALVTDPPYGTGWVRTRRGSRAGEFVAEREHPEWDIPTFNAYGSLLAGWGSHAVFSAISQVNDVRRIWTGGAIVHWRKTNPRPLGPDREAIILSPANLPDGIEFVSYNGDTPHHPCQKPLDLMQWVLGFIHSVYEIVDPFMGSGTTLLAAKNLGRPAIGIEIEERYCEIAARRLDQQVLDLGSA